MNKKLVVFAADAEVIVVAGGVVDLSVDFAAVVVVVVVATVVVVVDSVAV